jgi:hypothetical protein
VAGSARRPADRSASGAGADAPLGDALDAVVAASAQHARDLSAWTTGMDAAEDPPMAAPTPPAPTPPVLQDWTGPVPSGVDAPVQPAAPIPAFPTWTPPAWTPRDPAPATGQGAAMATAPDPIAMPRPAEGSRDAGPADDELVHVHDHDAVARAMPMPDPEAEPSWPSAPAPSIPGAYVAPPIVPSAAATVHGRPATATSIAAAAVADGTVTSVPASPRPERWYSVPGPAKDEVSAPGKAGLFSDLPFRTPRDLPAWLATVGSLVCAVGFVLPFSSSIVIGGGVEDTLFGRWGLANPANLVVMLAAVVLLFVTLIPSRIPASIRGATLPILLGGWSLGIVWSYASGPFGLGLGTDALGVGGFLLVIGGALAAARADDPPKRPHEADVA